METKRVPQAASEESQRKFTLAKLADEDIKLRQPILEAAWVAARLALDPGNRELRERAAKAWARVNSIIVRHLGKEDRTVFPWGRVARRVLRAIWSIAHVKSTSRSWRCTISLSRIPLKRAAMTKSPPKGATFAFTRTRWTIS